MQKLEPFVRVVDTPDFHTGQPTHVVVTAWPDGLSQLATIIGDYQGEDEDDNGWYVDLDSAKINELIAALEAAREYFD